jgi:plastocyanin
MGGRLAAHRIPMLGAITVVAVVAAVALLAAPVRAASADVAVVDYSFTPQTVTVGTGDTVTWTVGATKDPHTVSPVDPAGAFDGSGILRAGETFQVTFQQPGTYRYRCEIHPEQMTGTIIVAETSATPPGPSPTASASPIATAAVSGAPVATTTPTTPSDSAGGGLPWLPAAAGIGLAALVGAAIVAGRARSRRGA